MGGPLGPSYPFLRFVGANVQYDIRTRPQTGAGIRSDSLGA